MEAQGQTLSQDRQKSGLTKTLYVIFSIAATVGIFSYLFSHVTLAQVLNLIRNIDLGALSVFVMLSLVMSIFRTWRYRLLLRLSGYSPSSAALFLVVLVRNFFSDLLPARLGTLIYVYIVISRLGVPFAQAASSFALSFLFDMLALAPLLLVAVWFAAAGSSLPALPLAFGAVVLGLICIALVYALPSFCSLARGLTMKLQFLSSARRDTWVLALDSMREEILRIKKAGLYLPTLVLSLFVRLGKYSSFYFLLYALLHPVGYSLGDLKASSVFLGLVASELSASLPISGIGGFGVYEGTWALVFGLLGYPSHIAKLTGISHHLVTQIYGYSLGALALLILLLPIWSQASSRQDECSAS